MSEEDIEDDAYCETCFASLTLACPDCGPDWRPIETAPKDGTVVLIYQPEEDHKVSVAEWGIYGWLLLDFDPGYELTQRKVVASHWMPLPKPPT